MASSIANMLLEEMRRVIAYPAVSQYGAV